MVGSHGRRRLGVVVAHARGALCVRTREPDQAYVRTHVSSPCERAGGTGCAGMWHGCGVAARGGVWHGCGVAARVGGL
eukprot:111173-Prymnesium_polylepis.1